MIGLLKYGSGLPFNRLQRLQGSCGIPLAASTQWDIVDAASSLIAPAYEELIRQAAQADVVHNDDTTVRILELMGERVRNTPPPEDEHEPHRTGLFTSGVVTTLAGVRMALFSAVVGMRVKIYRTFCGIVSHSSKRRSRCATGWRGISPKNSTRSCQTVWHMVAVSSWNFTIDFPKNAGT